MESRIYLCRNCQCRFSSPRYKQECFPCSGDQEEWTLFEQVFVGVVMIGLLLTMVWLR